MELTQNPFQPKRLATAVFIGLCALSAGAYAAPGGVPGRPDGGGGPPTGGETAANNLSFPVILSDNVGPSAFPADGAWRWAPIISPATECIGEEGVEPGTSVDPLIKCYYGRHVTVSNEEGSTGQIVFDGDVSLGANPESCDAEDAACKVWWLQKRPDNFWKALSVGHDISTPLVVSAVDLGDLLESTPSIATRQIRVEFNLLQSVAADDEELGSYLADWTGYAGGLPLPSPCVVPTTAGQSIGCFAAFGMSGAVPGTEQSGNEMQGNDFGPGPDPGLLTGTLTVLNPSDVRTATLADGIATLPISALVYSHCARLVIQKIADEAPTWDETTGQWSGPGVGAPVVNVATYSGTNPWSVEITSSGSIVYGYNWNAKTVPTGTYRLTFVLDGNDSVGPQCTTTLATKFESPTLTTLGTQLVNIGENTTPHIVYAGDSDLGDEGGLAYIDLTLTTKGGGKKGGGNRP